MSGRGARFGGLLVVCALLAAGGAKPAVLLANEAAFARELKTLQADDATVLVHFWATWCGVCEEEFKSLAPALSKLSKSGVKVMLVSLDEPEQASTEVPAFLAKYKVTGLSYLLEDAEPEKMAAVVDPNWPVGALPATFVFRSGRRVKSFYGPVEPTDLVGVARAK